MLDVSSQYKKVIKNPSRLFKSLILINNKTYSDSEIFSINYDENLFMESDFSIGSANMAAIEIELKNTQDIIDDFTEGSEFEIKIGVEVSDDNFEFVSLGFFTIEDIDKTTSSIKIYTNDRMIKFEKDYITDLEFPATIKDITLDIANKAGVELKTKTFVNSDYLVPIKPDLTNITLRKALMYIAELAGGYARITRDGYLEIFNIDVSVENKFNYASEDLYTDEIISDELSNYNNNTVTNANIITLSNKVYTVSKIDTVIIENSGIREEIGEGENPYYITDNLFCQNPTAVIKNIYDVLSKISYIPFEIKTQGDPAVQAGDSITIRSNGALLNTLITSRSLSYLGGLTEQYKAIGKSNIEKQSTGKGNVSVEIEKSKTEIKIIAGEVEQKVSNEDFESYVKQTAEEIATKVTDKDVETLVTQNAESWNLSIDGKLSGKTYNFDGENFTIGSNKSGDKVEHNNTQSIYYHEDGSYTKISSKGLERYVNGQSKKYNYLTYTGAVWVNSGVETRINIPDEFKNKPYKVLVSINSLDGEYTRHGMRLSSFYLTKNTADNTGITVTAVSYYTWVDIDDREYYGQCGRISLSYILTL
ncbi:MAG: hypothetical protein NSGCLCUN01_03117 [uncultured Clostridium sp.]